MSPDHVRGHAIVVRCQGSQSNDSVRTQADLVQTWNTGDIDQGPNTGPGAALEFQEQVGRSRDYPRTLPLGAKNLQGLINTRWLYVLAPHRRIRP
jgi:hypothetical protein